MANGTMRLGELLVSKGLIGEAQLKLALEEQRATKEFLGTLLVRKGWLSRDALLQSLAEQLGITYAHLAVETIDWGVVARFSAADVLEHRVLPIAMDRKSVTVAMSNPLDVWGVGRIEQKAAGRRVQVVLVPDEELTAALKAFKQQQLKGLKI